MAATKRNRSSVRNRTHGGVRGRGYSVPPIRLEVWMMGFDYMSARWRAKRESILRRDSYQCRECRRYGRLREAQEVHHIKPVEMYPEFAFVDANLVSLCHACHNKMHPEKARAMRHGYGSPPPSDI